MICRILNGHISATGDPIDFMFGSKVWFSGLPDRMALFPVRSNPGWQPALSWKITVALCSYPATVWLSCN